MVKSSQTGCLSTIPDSSGLWFIRFPIFLQIPERWPVLEEMIIDDENRLWISTITEGEEHYVWWVLDQYGELLAQFQWPGQRLYRHSEKNEIVMVKNGYLYTRGTDEMGVASIVRYRIEMEEK